MRISDWSSDVCSSDLTCPPSCCVQRKKRGVNSVAMNVAASMPPMIPVAMECRALAPAPLLTARDSRPRMKAIDVSTIGRNRSLAASKIGRTSGRERVCQYVASEVFAVALHKKNDKKQHKN